MEVIHAKEGDRIIAPFRNRKNKTVVIHHDDTKAKFVYKRIPGAVAVTHMMNPVTWTPETRRVQMWHCVCTYGGETHKFSIPIPINEHIYPDELLEMPFQEFTDKYKESETIDET